MFRLESITDELREVVAELDPATYAGSDAARLTAVAAEVERLGAAAKVLFAMRAAETRGWVSASHAVTAEQWLANVSGCAEGAAREALRTAERVEALLPTAARLREGSLSLAQAAHVSAGATADPDAEAKLLRVAEKGEMRTLRTETERVVAAATDEARAHEIARRDRHLRTWTRGMATHGSFSGPTATVDALLRTLEALKVAIAERDERCKVRGCDRTAQLERHHLDDYATHHLTTYEILGNACPEHHDLITYEHYAVEINADGSWTLRPPGLGNTDAAQYAAPARLLAGFVTKLTLLPAA